MGLREKRGLGWRESEVFVFVLLFVRVCVENFVVSYEEGGG